MNPGNSVITMTFGEVAENHVGMQKLGSLSKEGFSIQDLNKAKEAFENRGATCELINLPCPIEYKNCEASVLVIRKGVRVFTDPTDLWKELSELDTDKKAKMRGRIVNKKARHNLCVDEFDQEPHYETGKGRVVSWAKVPCLGTIRDSLPDFVGEKAQDLKAEGNYYYDLSVCGIGYHGDSERKKVIAVRLGSGMPIFYRWYYKSERIGDPVKIDLHDGDMYIMSEKAVGTDWKLRNTPTLRHATGARKYTD